MEVTVTPYELVMNTGRHGGYLHRRENSSMTGLTAADILAI